MYVIKKAFVLLAVLYHRLRDAIRSRFGSPPVEEDDDLTEILTSFGLENSIELPTTGEEASSRILGCDKKDSYSLLGLRADASDEEIRRYYRKQAFLVHPDKNMHSGAEEAFKVLSQAFDLVATPEKRKQYDRRLQEQLISTSIMQQLHGMVNKLQENMKEASNWMLCSNCGDKHRRYLTDRPVDSARKCNRCQCHHPAKEGDIWAETTFLGFKWHFYACMNSQIYDVTAWVACQPSMTDKIQPNAHYAFRLRVDSSSKQNGAPSDSNSNEFGGSMADLDHQLRNLFPHLYTDTTTSQKTPSTTAKTGSSSLNKKSKRKTRKR